MDIKKENFLKRKTNRKSTFKNKMNISEKNFDKVSSIENFYIKAKSIYEHRVLFL